MTTIEIDCFATKKKGLSYSDSNVKLSEMVSSLNPRIDHF